MDSDVFYPTVDEVLDLHATIVGIPRIQAARHVRDENLLESALARPRNEAAYECATMNRQAATLLWGIARNHPFQDGNKRTAYVVMQAFLRGHGITIVADEDERYDLVIAVARGDLDVEPVTSWLDRHVGPWPTK